MITYDELYDVVKSEVSEKRFNHILGVVKRAEEYSNIYNVNIEEVKIAAIFHDIAKEYPEEKSYEILEKYGYSCKNLYLFMRKKYLVYIINKYYQYGSNGPIIPYLKLVCRCSKDDCDKFLNKVRSADLRVGDRVMYGLGISEDEYTDIVNIYADVYEKIENLSGRKK